MTTDAKIHYVTGDATRDPFHSEAEGPPFLVHIVNDVGKWESGFAAALSEVWPQAKERYLEWYEERSRTDKWAVPFELGAIQWVKVGYEEFVVNLIGQHSRIQDGEEKPIRYDAVRKGLAALAVAALYEDENDEEEPWLRGQIHMPRIGCGRARGEWSEIEKILQEEVIARGIYVYVYDLPDGSE